MSHLQFFLRITLVTKYHSSLFSFLNIKLSQEYFWNSKQPSSHNDLLPGRKQKQ